MKNKLITYFKSSAIISTLVIGIIGSALWEKLISPLSTFVFLHILSINSSISEKFSDDIYRSISYGFHEESSTSLLSIFLGVFTGFIIYVVLHFLRSFVKTIKSDINIENEESDTPSKLIFKNIYFVLSLIYLLALSILMMYTAGRASFINRSITKSLNNIEILSPFISDYNYKMLKSKFHLIKSKSDYDALNSEIEDLLKTYSIQLE